MNSILNLNKKILAIAVVALLLVVGTYISTAKAEHSWGNYHWGSTTSPFILELGDSVSSKWDTSLVLTASDWSVSSALDTVVVPGKNKRNCRGVNGSGEICSAGYGYTGWLGIAQIWISGGHITKGVVKVNDTYFDTPTYNTPAWRNLVMCQEVGHILGLSHTDENFGNEPEGTCMDYTSDPEPNQRPNQHDYDMLESIYSHLDNTDTVISRDGGDGGDGGGKGNGKGGGKGKPDSVGNNIDLNNPSEWGPSVKEDAHGNNSLYERNLGNGEKLITFVIWTK